VSIPVGQNLAGLKCINHKKDFLRQVHHNFSRLKKLRDNRMAGRSIIMEVAQQTINNIRVEATLKRVTSKIVVLKTSEREDRLERETNRTRKTSMSSSNQI
jgi:hypothetical protein